MLIELSVLRESSWMVGPRGEGTRSFGAWEAIETLGFLSGGNEESMESLRDVIGVT